MRRRSFIGLSAALALQMAWLRAALAAGTVEKGLYRVRGDVRVNGNPAVEGMEIKVGDVITAGANGEAVFVSGRDAFLVRANTRVEAQGGAAGELVLSGLRLVTGALLSVMAPGQPKTLRTATATIGIRGTAVYLEAEPARTYVCTCYGEAEIISVADPSARETVRANTRVEAQGGAAGELVLSGLRLVTGALLSVMAPGQPKTLRTATATIGIRGTAVYLEAEPARTYVCTCYGEAEIVSVADPSARETVRTQQHEQPRYVMGTGAPQMLMGAPVINHTDTELSMLESLVGRRPAYENVPGYRRERY